MKIGQLARRAGVSPDTVRYYEKIGLFPPAARRGNGYRDYGAEELDLLQFIRGAQSLGFSLSEIASVAARIGKDGVTRGVVEQHLADKIAATEQHIAKLSRMRDALIAMRGQLQCAPDALLATAALIPPPLEPVGFAGASPVASDAPEV